MSKKALETFSITALKTNAADVKLGWASLALEYLGLPGSPMPGTLNTVIKTLFDQYSTSRDYLGAYIGTKMSVQVGGSIAIEDYVSSDKVKKLLAAQTMMLAPDLQLVDPKLSYDVVRHNYAWAGTLIELQEHHGLSVDKRQTYCVVHPDEQFDPIALVSGLRVLASCTQANPNYANECRENTTYVERMQILKARQAMLK